MTGIVDGIRNLAVTVRWHRVSKQWATYPDPTSRNPQVCEHEEAHWHTDPVNPVLGPLAGLKCFAYVNLSRRPGDGWLMGVMAKGRTGRTFMLVLGPRGRADRGWLDDAAARQAAADLFHGLDDGGSVWKFDGDHDPFWHEMGELEEALESFAGWQSSPVTQAPWPVYGQGADVVVVDERAYNQ